MAGAADIVFPGRDVAPEVRVVVAEPVQRRSPLFPVLEGYAVHIGRRMRCGPFEGHHVVGRLGSGSPRIALGIFESRGIDGRSLYISVRRRGRIRERVFATPLVVKAARGGQCIIRFQRSEVAIHKDSSRSIGLGYDRRIVVHGPDMPRPEAFPTAVEKPDHGVAVRRTGRKGDSSVLISHILNDRLAQRSRFPQYAGRDARQTLGSDVERRAAVAHRCGVERIGGVQRGSDIAVGRTVFIERPGVGREFREDRRIVRCGSVEIGRR